MVNLNHSLKWNQHPLFRLPPPNLEHNTPLVSISLELHAFKIPMCPTSSEMVTKYIYTSAVGILHLNSHRIIKLLLSALSAAPWRTKHQHLARVMYIFMWGHPHISIFTGKHLLELQLLVSELHFTKHLHTFSPLHYTSFIRPTCNKDHYTIITLAHLHCVTHQ